MSFSLAATELNVTQSAISRQIRLLEDFLGFPLFVRMTRKVALTAEGATYHAAVERSLDILEEATQRKSSTSRREALRITIPQSLATLIVLPRLASFAAEYPDYDVRVFAGTHPVDFEREDVDIAIRLGPLPGERYDPMQPRIPYEMTANWRAISAFHLWDEVLTPLVSKKLLEDGPPITSPMDLCKFPLLHVSTRPTAWADWFRAKGVTPAIGAAGKEYGHFFMALDAVKLDQGIALAPTIFLKGMGRKTGLVCPITHQSISKSTN